jgi:hypothetical protein
MNKPYNIQNTNICNGIFHISFFKALLINEGETTRGEKGIGAKRPVTVFFDPATNIVTSVTLVRSFHREITHILQFSLQNCHPD